MAVSLGFGILFATGITLLLIPSMTLILEDVQRLMKRGWRLFMKLFEPLFQGAAGSDEK
jgi:hypothetical protein